MLQSEVTLQLYTLKIYIEHQCIGIVNNYQNIPYCQENNIMKIINNDNEPKPVGVRLNICKVARVNATK